MLRAILNRSWQQHPTRRQLYGHLPPITKTYKQDKPDMPDTTGEAKMIVSDVLLWTPEYGQSKAGRPARTFIQQLCDDTGCNPEDLLICFPIYLLADFQYFKVIYEPQYIYISLSTTTYLMLKLITALYRHRI